MSCEKENDLMSERTDQKAQVEDPKSAYERRFLPPAVTRQGKMEALAHRTHWNLDDRQG